MTVRGFSVFLPQGSKHDLFKCIYKMVHKLEQTQHLHYYKTMFKGELMRTLYIVRSALFRGQRVPFLLVSRSLRSLRWRRVSIFDLMEAEKAPCRGTEW